MLVLSRRKQEAIMVGGAVGFDRRLKVTVLEIRNGAVKLGFEGDVEIPVYRWEVWERIANGGRPRTPTEGPAAPIG